MADNKYYRNKNGFESKTGIVAIHDGEKSDKNLWEFLNKNLSHGGNALWLIRFAFPHEARHQLIFNTPSKNTETNKLDFLSLIRQNQNCDIRILLINPFSNNYLTKLDSEKADNCKIVRVKNQLIDLINNVIFLFKENERHFIGCYNAKPVWNLGIFKNKCQYKVLFKSYGIEGDEIGHGRGEELELISGKPHRLAESFVAYCQDLCSSMDTVFWKNLEDLREFTSSNKWASLFKSNVIKKDSNNQSIVKYFEDSAVKNIEFLYYRTYERVKDKYSAFKMPNIYSPEINKKNDCQATNGICLTYEPGFSWFEIITTINDKYDSLSDKDKVKASEILGILLVQSLEALKHFRGIFKDGNIAKRLNNRQNRENTVLLPIYPYEEKLKSAIRETISFVKDINSDFLFNLMQDSFELSNFLIGSADTVFRDAHIKNRIFKSNEDLDKTIANLFSISEKQLYDEIENNTVDIDFETAGNLVSEWDDICHILLFDTSGVLFAKENPCKSDGEGTELFDLIDILKIIFRLDITSGDETVFWKTILFRATREHLRRIWYANVMPNSYIERYQKEDSKYYLRLAIYTRSQIKSLPYLYSFLEKLEKRHEELFKKVNKKDTLFNLSPTITIPNKESDYEHSYANLEKASIEELKGIIINDLRPLIANDINEMFTRINDQKENSTDGFGNWLSDVVILKPNYRGIGIDLIELIKGIKKFKKRHHNLDRSNDDG